MGAWYICSQLTTKISDMKKLKFLFLGILSSGCLYMLSCTTDDIPPIEEDTADHRYKIPDEAFGEYLKYLDAKGVTEDVRTDANGNNLYEYYVDTVISKGQTGALNLSKAATRITTLQNAGVRTASVKITNIDGLKFFTNVNNITLTSNQITSIDLKSMVKLDTITLNNNWIGTLDVTKNIALKYLRYTASSQAASDQKLYTIDLSKNVALKYVDLTGHPGAPFPIPAAIYNQLTTANGVKPQ